MNTATRLSYLLLLLATMMEARERARNVILFIGDACGIPVLSAASIYAHGEPRRLFVHSLPHTGLSETSSASDWTTDSAAGMTAIVTGVKTDNGVVSMAPAVDGKRRVLKTILEYAEEHGLSTGVVSNTIMADATPVACFAHGPDREDYGETFPQILSPRFGDGVDVLLGGGRKEIEAAVAKRNIDLQAGLRQRGYTFRATPESISAADRRVVGLFDVLDYDMAPVVDRAIDILSKNPKGYFLMVENEVDTELHEKNIEAAMKRVVALDNLIRHAAERAGNDTLILFAADHSFDFRVRRWKRGAAIAAAGSGVRLDTSHAGEDVFVAARGPGAQRVQGLMVNTDLFHVMMAAFGWKPDRETR